MTVNKGRKTGFYLEIKTSENDYDHVSTDTHYFSTEAEAREVATMLLRYGGSGCNNTLGIANRKDRWNNIELDLKTFRPNMTFDELSDMCYSYLGNTEYGDIRVLETISLINVIRSEELNVLEI